MASRVTPKGVEAAIRALGKFPDQSLLSYWSRVLTLKEIIYGYTEGNEIQNYSLSGINFPSSKPWKLLLTQKRLVFAHKSFFGSENGKELMLSKIKAIDTSWVQPKNISIKYGKDEINLEITDRRDAESLSKIMTQLRFGVPPDGRHTLSRYSEDPSQMDQRSNKRQAIPAHVRGIVWERDNGQCVQCGSRRDLHFDHIIPVSLGGGNSVENIQVLCQLCNLRKSNRIDG